jgi:cell division transport system permease protein
MLGWLFASPPDRRLLGGGRLRGATPWLIAIMSFSILIIAASGLALANTAGLLTRSIQSRYALEVPGGAPNLDALTAMLKSTAGVSSVDPVPQSEMRRTLEKWLGPEAASAELPVPSLINFDAPTGADIGAIERRARSLAPTAHVAAHRDSVAPLLHSLRMLQWVAFGLVLLLASAAATAVVLAARGALDTHRSTIEVMHGIGANDLQIAHLFQRKIAIDALAGSIAGALIAALVLLVFTTGASFAHELTGGAFLAPVDILVLALLPLALTALATWVARVAVLAALREAL